MIDYLIYRLGMFLALHLPLRITYALATIIADIHFFTSKNDRTAVLDNLQLILNKRDKETFRIAKYAFRNFAKYLVDFFRFSEINEYFINENVVLKNIKHLDNALEKGRGVIILSAHLGNWELGGVVSSKLGYKTNVVALDHKNKRINDIFIRQRAMTGVKVISIGMALRKCFIALKKNEILGLLGDRDFSAHGIDIKFFGRTAIMPKGPAAFSIDTGAAIVPGFLLRNPDDTFTFAFEEEINYKPTGDRIKDLRAVTEKIIKVLEDYIREYPEQWYVFRKFWGAA
ncbi:MAG: hypothetical protein COS99_00450 [Candidatus Omnitrophica bacterium CG07_land_8_20_14_0_80_42_15]|uniref:Lipid A biosynthesis acyltransferase n=1 Tax=Candidatus Aquitaenariimonas noxiae TaxID=1974741 RepID=A0A2J0KYI8_9BACT|nr:MAG: hypothetical protein COS99_00450 [Candidatus Omnitrophica bacterium CG07_land_8_20_14_0_80_42_15]